MDTKHKYEIPEGDDGYGKFAWIRWKKTVVVPEYIYCIKVDQIYSFEDPQKNVEEEEEGEEGEIKEDVGSDEKKDEIEK